MNDRHQHWSMLEREIGALLQELSISFEKQDIETLRDFIDNREYGVALEWMWSVVKRLRIQLSSSQREQFRRLSQSMGIALD